MQFTATDKFLAFARGAHKQLHWRIYVRKTGSPAVGLDDGVWLDVTAHVDSETLQSQRRSIEYEFGKYLTDTLTLTLLGITWWKTHVFNATDSEYIECKVECRLGNWGDIADDIAYTFTGFIDKQYQPNETADKLVATAFTVQDIGQRISADYLTTQYLNTAETMLALQRIPGLFVKNASPSGKALNIGTHQINYRTEVEVEGYPASGELIENGTFDDEVNWILGSGWSITGNKAACTTSAASELRQYVRVDIGATYTVQFTLTNVSAGAIRPILQGTLGTSRSGNGTFSENIVAGSGIIGLAFRTTSSAFTGEISAVSLARVNTQTDVIVKQAQLDSGRFVALEVGDNTLGNTADADTDTEQLILTVEDMDDLPPRIPPKPGEQREMSLTDSVVVVTKGDTLPRQHYANAGVQFILTSILDRLGIESRTFDTLEMGTALGAAKISFVDNPPNGSYTGTKYAMVTIGTDMWLSVGHRVFQRSAETYALKATLTAGDTISKLMYNARNNHLWIFYGANDNGNGKLRRYDITSGTLSSEIVLSTTEDHTRHMSIEVVDYEYAGDAFAYRVVYTVMTNGTNGGTISQVNGTTLAVSTIFTGLDLSYPDNHGIRSQFMHQLSGGKVRFRTNDGNDPFYHEIQIDVSGVWQDNGQQLARDYDYDVAAYVAYEGRIYTWNPLQGQVESHTTSSATRAINLSGVSPSAQMGAMRSLNSKLYFTFYDSDPLVDGRYYYFYEFSNNETHDFQDYPEKSNAAAALVTAITNVGNRIYGIDLDGKLFMYDTKVALYIPEVDTSGKTLSDMWNDILASFLLYGTISAAKVGYVYRRADETGQPATTGNTLQLTVDDATDITVDELLYRKRPLVDISNGTTRFTFDGTDYNVGALGDVSRFTLSSSLIPGEIIQDVAYHAYQFFKTHRSLYRIPVGIMPLLQYEPFDGASITFTTTKIQKTASGPIMGVEVGLDGSMTFDVLLEA